MSTQPRADNCIFVFGSNLSGWHGAGAALQARREYGAEPGIGEGRTVSAYAIPTKDNGLGVRPLKDILVSVQRFVKYASEHPSLLFVVTRVGCGYAGYTDSDMGPMFYGSTDNVILPAGWGKDPYVDPFATLHS